MSHDIIALTFVCLYLPVFYDFPLEQMIFSKYCKKVVIMEQSIQCRILQWSRIFC